MTLGPLRSGCRGYRGTAVGDLSISLSAGREGEPALRRGALSALRDENGREAVAGFVGDQSSCSPTEVAGSTSVTGGWNKQPNPYTVYFCARTDTPAASWGTWLDGKLQPGSRSVSGEAESKSGAWLTFAHKAGRPVLMKIGISFISVEQARRNLAAEIPAFRLCGDPRRGPRQVESRARQGRNQGRNGRAEADFLHRALPHDADADGPHRREPALEIGRALLRRLLRDLGYLPHLRAAADADCSGTRDGDCSVAGRHLPARALSARRAQRQLQRPHAGRQQRRVHDYRRVCEGTEGHRLAHCVRGRGPRCRGRRLPITSRKGAAASTTGTSLGYVSIEGSDRPGSVHMEYAANDFEIALLARGLGKTADYRKYLIRSGNWKNLWDADFADGGFQGFIRPRHRDGSWLTPFTAMMSGTWNGNTFYEGNSWTYSTFVPQDVASLIEKIGGPQKFVDRLDAFFAVPGRYDVGNEPGFLDRRISTTGPDARTRPRSTCARLLRRTTTPGRAVCRATTTRARCHHGMPLGRWGSFPMRARMCI